MDGRDWVVLIKEPRGFRQLGPMETSNVKTRIEKGEVRYSDHVWKKGYKEWRRIGDLSEFGADGEPTVPPEEVLESPVDLSGVVRQVKNKVSISEVLPADVEPRDFAALGDLDKELPAFKMVKGLNLFEKDGSPVEILEDSKGLENRLDLVVRARIPLRVKSANFWEQHLSGNRWKVYAASVVFLIAVVLGKPNSKVPEEGSEAPASLDLNMASKQTLAPPAEAPTDPGPVAMNPSETAESSVSDLEAPSNLAPSPDENAAVSPITSEQMNVQRAELGALASGLLKKIDTLKQASPVMQEEASAMALYLSDWAQSLTTGEFVRLNDPAYAVSFAPELAEIAARLQNIYLTLLTEASRPPDDLSAKLPEIEAALAELVESNM